MISGDFCPNDYIFLEKLDSTFSRNIVVIWKKVESNIVKMFISELNNMDYEHSV